MPTDKPETQEKCPHCGSTDRGVFLGQADGCTAANHDDWHDEIGSTGTGRTPPHPEHECEGCKTGRSLVVTPDGKTACHSPEGWVCMKYLTPDQYAAYEKIYAKRREAAPVTGRTEETPPSGIAEALRLAKEALNEIGFTKQHLDQTSIARWALIHIDRTLEAASEPPTPLAPTEEDNG